MTINYLSNGAHHKGHISQQPKKEKKICQTLRLDFIQKNMLVVVGYVSLIMKMLLEIENTFNVFLVFIIYYSKFRELSD